jgi:hypothetical protein
MRDAGLDVQETPNRLQAITAADASTCGGRQLGAENYEAGVWHKGTELPTTILINDQALSVKRGRLTGEDRSENRPQG